MSTNRKPFNFTRKTLLGGIAGVSLVVGMSLAPVSFDFQGGQLSLKSIAAYASPGSDKDAGDRSAPNKASELSGGNSESDRSASNMASELSGGNSQSDRIASSKASEFSGGKSESDRSTSKDARDLANNKNAGDHNGNEKDASERGSNDRAANQGNNNQAGGNNASPLKLSDFISSLRKGNRVASSGGTGSNLELRYSDGWKEVVDNGRYVLRDPNGNTIINRLAKNADVARLRSAL